MTCALCNKALARGWGFCADCYEALNEEQRETLTGAVTNFWHAPAGRFNHFWWQLELVTEDLRVALRAPREAESA